MKQEEGFEIGRITKKERGGEFFGGDSGKELGLLPYIADCKMLQIWVYRCVGFMILRGCWGRSLQHKMRRGAVSEGLSHKPHHGQMLL